MIAPFKYSLYFSSFSNAREWRNGRRAGLRIQCRKAWGFKSPLSHHPQNGRFSLRRRGPSPYTVKNWRYLRYNML